MKELNSELIELKKGQKRLEDKLGRVLREYKESKNKIDKTAERRIAFLDRTYRQGDDL